MSKQCDGRWPAPQTAPPRDEAFPVTYRCGLPAGHRGPHGAAAGMVAPTLMPRVPWREGAIWLRYDGVAYVVSVERDGEWIDVIRDSGACSHIAEALGINAQLASSAPAEQK